MAENPVRDYRDATRKLAAALGRKAVYDWLVDQGYFPECYVLPPSFRVERRPGRPCLHFRVPKKATNAKRYPVDETACVEVHFPKSPLTDRTFGIMDPMLHNDIAFHMARHWPRIAEALIPVDSDVTSYSFPLPIDSARPGELSDLRSGRMIYEYLGMIDDDLAAIAYRYKYIVRTDIKNFYPSIYTHSLSWALEGKAAARAAKNDFRLLGNRLDRLFQRVNDGCTNGIPIGPVVSDLAAEIIASAVDRSLTQAVRKAGITCEVVRFKDDYRFLVRSEEDGAHLVKLLQAALKEYSLEVSESKTSIQRLPEGLFREWASRYHAVLPKTPKTFSWKTFRELYLAVLEIDSDLPGTGVIDRFLADLVSSDGHFKVTLWSGGLQKALSMLLMLGSRRVKAFPKVMAIIESVYRSPFGILHTTAIVEYLEEYLDSLAQDEERNRYLIAWIGYFLVSNKLVGQLSARPSLSDTITRSVFANRSFLFTNRRDYKLFKGAVTVGKQVSMLQHLDLFNPPDLTQEA